MSKFIALTEISNEDWKTQLAQGYPNVPKGSEVKILQRDFRNFYGRWVLIQWNGNKYYTRMEYIKEVEDNE